MEYWVKVAFKEADSKENLMKVFFEQFHPENDIEIENDVAKLRFKFEDHPPFEIIEAISKCEIINLKRGVEEEELSFKGENLKEQEEASEEEKKKRSVRKVSIPVLEEIASKSSSFGTFVTEVVEWMEMKNRAAFLKSLILSAMEVEELSWDQIEQRLREKGVNYTSGDKGAVSRKLRQKFRFNSTVTTLPFLDAIKQYKTYFLFKKTEKSSGLQEDHKSEGNIGLLHFKGIADGVDKHQLFEDRVSDVLKAMGIEKISEEEQQKIFEIAITAVKLKYITWEEIFSTLEIDPSDGGAEYRLTFSRFINDFYKEYNPNEKVKVLDFLKELQNAILREDER